MLSTYKYPKFEYRRPPDLDSEQIRRYRVVVVGAGPIGLAAAIECRLGGQPVVLLDEDDTVSTGSRGVCYAKRSLEILDRIGCGDAVAKKGVSWNVGRLFFREKEVYNFNLVHEADHKRPGMINLQQYYLEEFEVVRARELGIDLRWKHKVVSIRPADDRVRLQVETPEGAYWVEAEWLIAADGARSTIRHLMGLEVEGRVFADRFLIADVVMKAEFPAERWFWFDPPFHRNQSALLHRQADNVWRIDFQLGPDADPEVEKTPERVIPRIRAMLGDEREFELEWVSVYKFQCRRMASFRQGRVLFVGDAAHQVSPFGARGANSGYQDTDNLGWKLKLVMEGKAPVHLLDSYSEERTLAADENILNSTRSTDFMTPKSTVSKLFRNAVLEMAQEYPFARKLVNSGRLSVPAVYVDSSLNTPDIEPFSGNMIPGAPADDGPLEEGEWLIDKLGGSFHLLAFAADPKTLDSALLAAIPRLAAQSIPVRTLVISKTPGSVPGAQTLVYRKAVVEARYDGRPGTLYLIRPDQHVAARWRTFDEAHVQHALARATCNLRRS